MIETEDIDGLAGEYVLGSLDAAERAEVASRLSLEPSLRIAIAAWERRLAPLVEQTPEVAPRPEVLEGILARIAPRIVDEQALGRPRARVLPGAVRLAIGAGALAACLALAVAAWFFLAHPGKPKTEAQVAAMNCGALYKDFWGKLDREIYSKISAEQLAGVSRMALRAYDACQAGDELDAVNLFARLHKIGF